MRRRIFAFLVQLILWVPLSAIINLCAIGPILALFGVFGNDSPPFITVIFLLPMMWAAVFFLNKLRFKLKGKETDDYYNVVYDNINVDVKDLGDYYKVTETHSYSTGVESSNTFWGWMGIILSFVALPLQLVALFMSFLALFFPVIYSTSRKLPGDTYFSVGNIILHSLFDFVIVPCYVEKKNPANPKGFLWILLFISVPIADILAFGLPALLIRNLLSYTIPTDFFSFIFLLGFVFVLLCIAICIVKYGCLIVYSCSRLEARKYVRKLGRLSMLAAGLLVMFAFLY